MVGIAIAPGSSSPFAVVNCRAAPAAIKTSSPVLSPNRSDITRPAFCSLTS